VDQAELERARQRFEDEVRARLPGRLIDRVGLQQFGEDPDIEPGELLGRIVLALPRGADPGDARVRQRVLDDFQQANPGGIDGLRKAFGARSAGAGLFAGDEPDAAGPVIRLMLRASGRAILFNPGGEQPRTVVRAHLGPDDLETLDTLIAAGIAGSRAEAVRWALARIRESPAYAHTRARSLGRGTEDPRSRY
jgi:Arc/MetJ-type ribon-helix-helix transcriptional regulator